jgi:GAF domain-containing protein
VTDPTVGETDPADLAEMMGRVARVLEAEPDLQQTIEAIVGAAVTTVPGVQHAGVSLVGGEKPRTLRSIAASSEVARRMNKLEHEVQEGPCLDAIAEHRVFRSGDLSQEARWPHFAPRAREAGVVSMLGFRLFASGRTLGSLDLYSAEKNAFDEESVRVGDLLAAHAAVAVIGMERQGQLEQALDTRDTIATAKGILMGRDGLTAEQAFATLARTSQRANMKLRDVAAWLVADAERQVGS